MNTQDKELDELFRSKLDNYEVQPSSKVWANINNELGTTAQRKSMAPFLRVAASVAILIAAGLYFIPKKQAGDNTVQPKGGNKVAYQPVTKPLVNSQQISNAPQPVAAVKVKPAIVNQPKQLTASVVRHQRIKPVAGPASIVGPTHSDVVADNAPQQTIAAVTKPAVPNPVLPTNETALSPKIINAETTFVTQPEKVYANNTADTETKPAKKRKIHGLGGFINAVVGVVDKREDKIIEFTDTDEGDAVTGINLGIFKVKKVK